MIKQYFILVLVSAFLSLQTNAQTNASQANALQVKSGNSQNTEHKKDTVYELQQLINGFNSLKGEFTQMTTDSEQNVIQQQTGQFFLRKPDKLRWQINEPWAQLLIADGESIWLYDQDLQQVTRRAWSSRPEDNPAMLLLDGQALADYYQVTEIASTKGSRVFELQSLNNSAVISQFELRFTDRLPSQMRFRDSLDQLTEIRFGKIKSKDIKLRLFEFDMPEGVELLDES